MAFLRIEGGTPDAEVFIDGREAGKLNSEGSLAPTGIAPDIEHSIRIQKQDYEAFDAKRHAKVKDTILISASEARLKPFGTLVFEVKPPGAHVTIHQQNETAREVTDKTMRLREGTYIVNGTADQYLPFKGEEQVVSGQERIARVMLTPLPPPVIQPPAPTEIPELFGDSKNWKRLDNGFWFHEGPSWLKDGYFTHAFEVLKPKKGVIRQEKVRWRIYLEGGNYIECELDDSAFYRREMVDGKFTPQKKMPHKAGGGTSLHIEITVERDRVIHKIGQVNDIFPCTVKGQTGFDGKVGLRLAKAGNLT